MVPGRRTGRGHTFDWRRKDRWRPPISRTELEDVLTDYEKMIHDALIGNAPFASCAQSSNDMKEQFWARGKQMGDVIIDPGNSKSLLNISSQNSTDTCAASSGFTPHTCANYDLSRSNVRCANAPAYFSTPVIEIGVSNTSPLSSQVVRECCGPRR